MSLANKMGKLENRSNIACIVFKTCSLLVKSNSNVQDESADNEYHSVLKLTKADVYLKTHGIANETNDTVIDPAQMLIPWLKVDKDKNLSAKTNITDTQKSMALYLGLFKKVNSEYAIA